MPVRQTDTESGCDSECALSTRAFVAQKTKWYAITLLSAILLLANPVASAQSITHDASGLKIELSEDVRAAIDSGVSLTFESQFSHTKRFLFFRWRTEVVQHNFVVTRHTLSNRYLVHENNKPAPHIFTSMRETMAFISESALDRFAKYHWQQSHAADEHQIRLRLSKTKLPGPMRLTAFIAADWDLDSGWSSWHSDQ